MITVINMNGVIFYFVYLFIHFICKVWCTLRCGFLLVDNMKCYLVSQSLIVVCMFTQSLYREGVLERLYFASIIISLCL